MNNKNIKNTHWYAGGEKCFEWNVFFLLAFDWSSRYGMSKLIENHSTLYIHTESAFAFDVTNNTAHSTHRSCMYIYTKRFALFLSPRVRGQLVLLCVLLSLSYMLDYVCVCARALYASLPETRSQMLKQRHTTTTKIVAAAAATTVVVYRMIFDMLILLAPDHRVNTWTMAAEIARAVKKNLWHGCATSTRIIFSLSNEK